MGREYVLMKNSMCQQHVAVVCACHLLGGGANNWKEEEEEKPEQEENRPGAFAGKGMADLWHWADYILMLYCLLMMCHTVEGGEG